MVDLGLNQYRIKEIKYEIKEGKTVVFKLHNFNLEDVEIIEEKITEETMQKELVEEQKEEEKKEFNLNEIMLATKPKQLNDYEPISCLKNEKGMQETLEASRHKQWKEDVRNNPKKPSKTGNALFPNDDNIAAKDLKYTYKDFCASTNEIAKFLKEQKNIDLKEDIRFRNKHEKKLVKELVNAKKLIDDYTTKMSAVEKERFSERVRDKYFKLDPNDEFSRIKTLNDLNNLNANYSSLSSDEPEMKPISDEAANTVGFKKVGTMKIDRKTDKIIEFKPNKNIKKSED